MSSAMYLFAADLLLAVHVGFVFFVIAGLILTVTGHFRGWEWVQNAGFRIAHLVAIAIVVLQSWLARICPLTTWEMALRERAGDATYPGSFIAHWLEAILYYRAPPWVFMLCYTVFGAAVVAAWFWIPPRFGARRNQED